MSRPLTVVQLVPALHSGGAERSTLEIGAALVAAGHRSIVVSAGGRLVAALERHGSEHRRLDVGRKSPATLARVVTLRRWLREWRPDVVHARSRLPAWLARVALATLPAPRPHFVTSVHGLNSPGWYSSIMVRGERAICVSRAVRDYVARHYPQVDARRLVVIPRGVDPAAFPFGHRPSDAWRAAFATAFPALADRPILLLPARGTRLKNHGDAIRVLARVRGAHGVDAALLLLGVVEPGRERYVEELRELATALGVAAHVAFSAPRADVADVYASARVVLQLSRQPESFGRTVVEALSIGVPVVGYAHGGVGELLQELFPDGAVPFGDVEAAAARVAALVESPPALAPLAGYRLADMQARTLALYAELAGGSA
jgi:glycosyltransferase involved in cell wall biosynthesis